MATYTMGLFAGHGNGDPGATGNGYNEADLTWELAQRIHALLIQHAGFTVQLGRNNYDNNYPLANDYTSRYCLSIHFNASNGQGTGTEAWVPCREPDLELEFDMLDRLRRFGLPIRGVRSKNYNTDQVYQRANDGTIIDAVNWMKEIRVAWEKPVTSGRQISLTILEVAFIDNANDMNVYQANKEEYIYEITNSILYWLGEQEMPRVTINNSGIVEGNVTLTATPQRSGINYVFEYTTDPNSGNWNALQGQTSNTCVFNVNSNRGKQIHFRVRTTKGAKTSLYSNTVSCTSNRLPTPATNLRFEGHAITSLQMRWDATSDPDGHNVNYKIHISKDGVYGSPIDIYAPGISYTMAIQNDPTGTVYKFKIETIDSLGGSIMSAESAPVAKAIEPNAPTFTNPSSDSVKKDSFQVTINPVNFQGLPGNYELEKRKNGGAWESYDSNWAGAAKTFDINSIAKGDTIQFRVRSVVGGAVYSGWTESGTVRRNRVPNAPVITSAGISTYPTINVTWNAATDPDGQTVTYDIYVSRTGSAYAKLNSSPMSTTTQSYTIPAADIVGTTYKFRVDSVDTLGETSSTETVAISKIAPPSVVSGLTPNSGYCEDTATLSWNAEVSAINYEVKIYVDDMLKSTVLAASNSYGLDLSGIPRGSNVKFGVIAVNNVGMKGAEVKTSNGFNVNRIPGIPKLSKPITGGRIFTQNPKILIYGGVESDNQNLIIFVKYHSNIYNSRDNEDMFSRPHTTSEGSIIFKCVNDLIVGANNLEIWCNDGLIDSPKLSATINVVSYTYPEAITGDYITPVYYNKLIENLEFLKASYEYSPSSRPTNNKGDVIFSGRINSIINGVNELSSFIDRAHPDNKFVFTKTIASTVVATTYVAADIFNEISDRLKEL